MSSQLSVFPSDFKCIAVSAALKVPMWSSKKVRTVTTVNQFPVFVHAQDEQNLSDPNSTTGYRLTQHNTFLKYWTIGFRNVPTPRPDPSKNYSVLVRSCYDEIFGSHTSASVPRSLKMSFQACKLKVCML